MAESLTDGEPTMWLWSLHYRLMPYHNTNRSRVFTARYSGHFIRTDWLERHIDHICQQAAQSLGSIAHSMACKVKLVEPPPSKTFRHSLHQEFTRRSQYLSDCCTCALRGRIHQRIVVA